MIEFVCTGAEIATANDVEWAVEVLTGRLSGERLADTRWTEEVDDETLALATNEVVEGALAARAQATVRFNEGAQQRLPLGRKDQSCEYFVIPVDRRDVIDVVFD